MKAEQPTIIECSDGSVEIYESSRKKFNAFLQFGLISIMIVVLIALRPSWDHHLTVVMGIPTAVVSALLALALFPFNRTRRLIVIKFTSEGITVYRKTTNWSDIKSVHTSKRECVLVSRKAGEIYLNTTFLETTPEDLCKLVFRFAPDLERP